MKNKKLANWLMNNKRYEIVEKPHSIFQTEVVIREFTLPPEKKRKIEGDE